MIESIKHKGLRKFAETSNTSGIQAHHQKKIRIILSFLQSADSAEDMAFPGSELHPLKGTLAGFWSVKVSGNWRIIFRMENGNAHDVDYIDYH